MKEQFPPNILHMQILIKFLTSVHEPCDSLFQTEILYQKQNITKTGLQHIQTSVVLYPNLPYSTRTVVAKFDGH